jgi:hypothetical protein
MAETQLTQQEVQQLEGLRETLTRRSEAEAVGGIDICGIWQTAKPFWPLVVRAARLIPGVGNTVAEILQKIGDFLDLFCAGGGGNG